jgi:hypothetical protein
MRLILAAATSLVLAGCLPVKPPEPTPAMDFANFCSACHGTGGKGDGPVAADLAKRPADLTRLSARNHGKFPTTRVMAQIWGYTGKKGDGVMPDFAPLLEGDLVPYDGGDGIMTPTPIRLVELAEYLKALQQPRR